MSFLIQELETHFKSEIFIDELNKIQYIDLINGSYNTFILKYQIDLRCIKQTFEELNNILELISDEEIWLRFKNDIIMTINIFIKLNKSINYIPLKEDLININNLYICLYNITNLVNDVFFVKNNIKNCLKNEYFDKINELNKKHNDITMKLNDIII